MRSKKEDVRKNWREIGEGGEEGEVNMRSRREDVRKKMREIGEERERRRGGI